MNWFDIAIIIIILLFAIGGFKRGVFKEIVIFLGMILVFFLAYKFKNVVGDFFVVNFPYISFKNTFLQDISSLNIIIYQAVAFIIMMVLFYIIYEFLVSITGLFEKLLRFTIVLGIPSKILGFLVGAVEGYVVAFVIIFFVALPTFNFKVVNNSKYAGMILNSSPVLTNITKDSVDLFNKVKNIPKSDNANDINLKIIDIILDKKVTSVPVIEQLVANGKLNVKDVDSVIKKYK